MSKIQELEKFLKSEPLPIEEKYLKNAKKFTVLMSTYINDDVNDLDIAIKSVIQNTVVPDEIVIMVDGPVHDQTKVLLDMFTNHYPDILKVIYQETNQGLGITAANGVIYSKNEIIARMDADDISNLERFEQQLEFMHQNNSIVALGGQVYEFDEKLEFKARRTLPLNNDDIVQFSKLRSPLNHPTVMFRKSSVMKAGNYQNTFLMEDYDLWMRMIEKNMIFHNIEQDLVYMRAPKDMYRRRGGFKYLSVYHEFRKRLLRKHLISYKDYYKSMIGMSISSLMPNIFREKLYKKLLRNN
ncbi:glycosyltransferase [Leuconostoc pseudomesenteroides]|uniref:glycosyltransferase n=1 Tax=Leuconostoc pseudomesenteroides TaxID=33968 RepID=UPI001B8CA359|nr:glycosyltransferase [Leuconostoc pseudomesenteroides]MBS0958853.1 glycosyltransferase [Leuconostoc pseudomesenteroides]